MRIKKGKAFLFFSAANKNKDFYKKGGKVP
jgi:hypothetical protein